MARDLVGLRNVRAVLFDMDGVIYVGAENLGTQPILFGTKFAHGLWHDFCAMAREFVRDADLAFWS